MSALIILIPGLINLLLGFFVWNRARKSYLHITFGIFAVATFVLILLDFLFRLFPTLPILQATYAFASLLPAIATLWVFALANIQLKYSHRILIFIPAIIFFVLSFVDGMMVRQIEELLELGYRGTLGPAFSFFSLYILSYLTFLIYIILTSIKKAERVLRAQLRLVFLGIILYGFFATVFSVVLPAFFGVFTFTMLDAPSSIFFVGFTFYAILKHHLFNIKVIATEIFTFILLLILVFNVFSYTSIAQLVLNISILLGTAVVGIFLIRSVIWEVETKEELQKAYEELKRLDKAKSEFVSIASHQLRTPLTAIKGYISMIIEGGYKRNPRRQKEVLESVYQSNERLIHLVNDLLSLSRIESGKIEVQKESVNIEKLAQEVVNELSIKAKEKNIDLNMKAPGEKIPSFFLDTEKTRNVLLNLLDNAIRYTEKGSVSVKIVPMYENKILAAIQIQIQDTGEGMEQEEIEGLFESFRRGKAGQQTWTEGAGLGLYIAKRFLELQGGTISATSQGKGKGSTFTIELPYQTNKE